VADPYAIRRPGPVPDRPATASPFAALIADRGGTAVATLADPAAADLPAAGAFVAVLRTDEGLLPPLARIDASFAIALLADAGAEAAPADRSAAARALAALRATNVPIYLVKDGLVAGPAGREGAVEVSAGLAETALDAAIGGTAHWERDPDFGYDVIAALGPGASLPAAEADALCPRLTYAAADRVYEHADLVAEVKRTRRERLERVVGLDPAIVAASGWPSEPTATAWKD
jgi:hypothetical protein